MGKKIILILLNNLGINNLFSFLNRNKALILWYHGICDDNFDLLKGYDERHIPKSLFKKQLSYLKRKKYFFVTMSELIDILNNKKKVKKAVVLTFDDGFRNVVENVYPIMKEFNAKGCFYLVSSLIGKGRLLWTDYIETIVRNSEKGKFKFIFEGEKIYYTLDTKKSYEKTMKDIKLKLRTISEKSRKEHMRQFNNIKINNIPKEFLISSWEQIISLDNRILEIGAHTKTHPNCENLTSDLELEDEINTSKREIEKMISYKIDHFCYPAGSYNDEVIKYLKKCGYKSAVTVINGFNDKNADFFKLKRISIDNCFLKFKAYTSGSYLFIKKFNKVFFGGK